MNHTAFDPSHDNAIAIAASFTAETIAEPLAFWLDFLDITADIIFAPYNQLFQQLLDPTSLISTVRHGVSVILLRFGDWCQGLDLTSDAAVISQHLTHHSHQFAAAVHTFARRASAPLFICVCPEPPAIAADQHLMPLFEHLEAYLASEMRQLQNVWFMPVSDTMKSYPVAEYYDRRGDELGRIPFTSEFFAGIGTLIARMLYALYTPPHKVLVLDCDNTLWGGLCAEDGVNDIQLSPPYLALQQFVIRQHEAGMLICLCSKNNEDDVAAVFADRSGMLLSRDHIVTWRINWGLKSENIRSLAKELQLGLDSFVIIDDNPLECAEIQAACPEALTLQLPADTEQIPQFLAHVWAFDRLGVTEEDRQRTLRYKQNAAREHLRTESLTLEDFLEQLGLEVTISPVETSHYARVAQLIQRTNQFNTTTIRRSESDVRAFCQSLGGECLVVDVRDRFGDYGLVGAVLFKPDIDGLNIDTFLLSCRVLGKRIEHRVVARLGEIAQERGLDAVNICYIPSSRNQPALDFLNSLVAAVKQPLSEGFRYCLPADQAVGLTMQPTMMPMMATQDVLVQADSLASVRALPDIAAKATRLSRIARDFTSAEQISAAVEAWRRRVRDPNSDAFVAPRTPTEALLSDLWTQVLGLDRVSVYDNFFVLGGHSLVGTRLLSRICDAFQIELAQGVLFEAPTIMQLAEVIEYQSISLLSDDELALCMHELDALSDDQVRSLLDHSKTQPLK